MVVGSSWDACKGRGRQVKWKQEQWVSQKLAVIEVVTRLLVEESVGWTIANALRMERRLGVREMKSRSLMWYPKKRAHID